MIISNIGGKLMSRTNRKEYEDWKGFGERTKRSRESWGLTREKFAEMIDRTENYTLSLEKGDKSCSIHTLHQICCALKASSDYILYGENRYTDKEFTDREILLEIINRCDSKELKVIKEVIVAMYPNFKEIVK
jgi:DNA-binding XRE family transcriptional regulator